MKLVWDERKTAQRLARRPHLSTIALISFIISFIVARVFSTFFPSRVLIVSGIHIHHFWYGLAMLAVGGWLGISYNNEDTDRLAAILYGAGGGLIVDEAGLLLTFGNYWSGLTFTVLVVVLASAFVLSLLYSYRQVILRELGMFKGYRAGVYLAVFLFTISIAFVTETTNFYVTTASGILATAAIVTVVVSLVLRHRKPKQCK
jgi:hypothetical protein